MGYYNPNELHDFDLMATISFQAFGVFCKVKMNPFSRVNSPKSSSL